MSEPGVSITLKAHAGFDSPWIVVHGATAAEASAHLEQLREMTGTFSAIKTLAAEFASAPTTGQAVATVQAAMPGAAVVPQTPPQAPAQQYQPPVQQAPPAYAQPVPPPGPPQYQPTPPIQQSTPPCETCGQPTTLKTGVSARGPWSMYACATRIREHNKFL